MTDSPPVLTRAEKVIAFIERYMRVPEGDLVGQKVSLEKFQKDFIYAIYDNKVVTKKAILSMARKNAKTALIAMLAIVHLIGPEAKQNSRIVSGAQSKEQAAEVFNYCDKILTISPELAGRVRILSSKKTIMGYAMNVTYKALSAEGKTNMGGSPILAILDEVGQIVGPQDDFVDSVTTSQGAYDDALLIAISTQAQNDSDLLSIWIDDALESKDPHIVCHLHTTPADADLMDEKEWKKSNPALGKFRSLSDLRSLAAQANRMPSSEAAFRNLNLNQRVAVTSPFITKNVWMACKGDIVPLEECSEVYGGLDLSKRTDLTALILYGLYNEKWYIYPKFWTPEEGLRDRAKRDKAPYDIWVKDGYMTTTPGATVDYGFVANRLMQVFEMPNFVALAYDRWRMDVLKKELSDMGLRTDELPLKDWGQGFKDMSPALDSIESALLNKKLVHDNNPVMNMCCANTMVISDPAGNRKPDKLKTSGRIDGFIALAMAAGIAEREHEKEGNLDDFLSSPLIT